MVPSIGLRSQLVGARLKGAGWRVSMASELKLSFPATISGLIASLEAIDHAGATWSLDIDLVSRVRIIVEELFSNTIKYGYGQECERPVRLRLGVHPELTLTY